MSENSSTSADTARGFVSAGMTGPMGPMRIRHGIHEIATQPRRAVDRAGWQAKVALNFGYHDVMCTGPIPSANCHVQLSNKHQSLWTCYGNDAEKRKEKIKKKKNADDPMLTLCGTVQGSLCNSGPLHIMY